MRLHRFFTNAKLEKDITYASEEQLHQWKNVFRYKEGDRVILFGDGFEHEYKIISIDRKSAVLHQTNTRKSRIQEKNIVVALALIKKENFEVALSKCTEIGVTKFIPIISDRSIQKPFGEDRLKKVLVEAVEQSGWGACPELLPTQKFKDLLKENVAVFDMQGKDIKDIIVDNKILCIGPEGGWSDDEINLAQNLGTLVKLNTGILRAETGAIVVSGIIKNTL